MKTVVEIMIEYAKEIGKPQTAEFEGKTITGYMVKEIVKFHGYAVEIKMLFTDDGNVLYESGENKVLAKMVDSPDSELKGSTSQIVKAYRLKEQLQNDLPVNNITIRRGKI